MINIEEIKSSTNQMNYYEEMMHIFSKQIVGLKCGTYNSYSVLCPEDRGFIRLAGILPF